MMIPGNIVESSGVKDALGIINILSGGPRRQHQRRSSRRSTEYGFVQSVNTFTFTVDVLLLHSSVIISNVVYPMSGSVVSISGKHPVRGMIVEISQSISDAEAASPWRLTRAFPPAYLEGYQNMLSLYINSESQVTPFHPYYLQGDSVNMSESLSLSANSVYNHHRVYDGQEIILDPITHKSVDNAIHKTQYASGVLSLRGPILRDVDTANLILMPDNSKVNYLTKGFTGANSASVAWYKQTDFDVLNDYSVLTEDSYALFEYSNLTSLVDHDINYINNLSLMNAQPLLLYGKGTFTPPLKDISDWGDKTGKFIAPKVHANATATESGKSWTEYTGTSAPNYDPIVSWTILPGASTTDDVYTCLHKSGKLSVALGKDSDSLSLAMDASGAVKITVGANASNQSILLDVAGTIRIQNQQTSILKEFERVHTLMGDLVTVVKNLRTVGSPPAHTTDPTYILELDFPETGIVAKISQSKTDVQKIFKD